MCMWWIYLPIPRTTPIGSFTVQPFSAYRTAVLQKDLHKHQYNMHVQSSYVYYIYQKYANKVWFLRVVHKIKQWTIVKCHFTQQHPTSYINALMLYLLTDFSYHYYILYINYYYSYTSFCFWTSKSFQLLNSDSVSILLLMSLYFYNT